MSAEVSTLSLQRWSGLPRPARWIAVAILAALAFWIVAWVGQRIQGNPLQSYQWENRVLLLYVPDTDPAREALEAFETQLKEREAELKERDLLVCHVGPHPKEIPDYSLKLKGHQKAELVRRYVINNAVAKLILVDKDGAVRVRQSQGHFNLDRIFSLVDMMPGYREG